MTYDLKDTTIQNLVDLLADAAGRVKAQENATAEILTEVLTLEGENASLRDTNQALQDSEADLAEQLDKAEELARDAVRELDRRSTEGRAQVERLVADVQRMHGELKKADTDIRGWRFDCGAALQRAGVAEKGLVDERVITEALRIALAEANSRLEQLETERRHQQDGGCGVCATLWIAKEDVDSLGLGVGILDKDGDSWYQQSAGGWHDTQDEAYAEEAKAGTKKGAWGFDNESVDHYFGEYIQLADPAELGTFRPAGEPGFLPDSELQELHDLRELLQDSFNEGRA